MTTTMMIERVEGPNDAVRKAIDDVLEVFNDAASGRPEPERPFAVLIRDAEGRSVGGAFATSYWDWVFLGLLALPNAQRGQGIGTRVMRTLESEAVRRGCRGMWLDTISFQAPVFYRKQGFSEFARLDDYGPGHSRHWFRKTDLRAWPDQGLPIVEDFTETDRDTARAALIAFSERVAGPSPTTRFGFVLRPDDGGPIVGGLWGRYARGWMVVELLVVPAALRGQGFGSRLLEMAEEQARADGVVGVWLDTFSFQARPFYERHGYRVFGELPDYPPPHSRLLMARRFQGERG